MAEYLLPDRNGLTIPEKQELFSFRNRMYTIKENFPHMDLPEFCVCGLPENTEHIYTCDILNPDIDTPSYNNIFISDIKSQLKSYKRMKYSANIRKEYIHIFE